MAEALKAQGNKAFAAKDWDTAIDLFSQAIKLDPTNHVLFSNRSAAYAGKREWEAALKDADSCIQINPKWGKGYARKGAALHGARQWDDAVKAYEEGIAVEDSPALQKGLKEVKDAQAADTSSGGGGGGGEGIANMFADPQLFAKLAANPKTAPLLADAEFMAKLRLIQQNPAFAQSAFNDPRMISVLGVLMGIDMQGFARDEGSNEMPPGFSTSPPPTSASTSKPTTSTSGPSNPTPPKRPATPPAPEAKMEEVEEEEDEDAKIKAQALAEKSKGNDAYKKRDFDAAITAFQKAWDLYPKDLTFLTNLSAAQFEKGDYDASIETATKAVDTAREIRADFKLVAKAFGRIGTCYHRKGDLENAVKFYQKSLTEHRTPDILQKLRETEKAKKEAEVKAYINPELAEKAREDGNAKFKAGLFADAVGLYSEAIKRNPADPRGYNNRALAYTKLAALPEALKDAEEAIKVDPKFVKGYIRKSVVLFAMREFTKAMEAAQQATDADEERTHTAEIQGQISKIQQALYAQRANETEEETLQRAMRDPEVASIMQDPIINQILQQAQQDPRALADHMKNPGVKAKIEKLVNAGIIRTR